MFPFIKGQGKAIFNHCELGFSLEKNYSVPAPGNCSALFSYQVIHQVKLQSTPFFIFGETGEETELLVS